MKRRAVVAMIMTATERTSPDDLQRDNRRAQRRVHGQLDGVGNRGQSNPEL
jgi:hypothetical protein